MRVVVVGGGMLARALLEEAERRGVEALDLPHSAIDVASLASVAHWVSRLRSDDVLINCAGILPGGTAIESVLVNSLGPHILANALVHSGASMIHVSTDCVYSSVASGHPAHRDSGWDAANPKDIYGRTKLAGEVLGNPQVTNVRTSFVGPDHGLWAWVAGLEDGATVEGWKDAWWSGSTVWEVARVLIDMAVASGLLSPNTPQRQRLGGTIHLSTFRAISKLQAVRLLADHLHKEVTIVPTSNPIDRSLHPDYLLHPLGHALGMREKALA